MPTTLHILTKADDSLAREIMADQQLKSEIEVAFVDLTVAEPNYENLLHQIFAADSVVVW